MDENTKELQRLLLAQQEEALYHTSIEQEYQFYREVQQGNLDILYGALQIEPTPGMGILSDQPLRNMRYHLIILLAMLTRFCIEGGLEPETAYTMSDLFIRQADKAEDANALAQVRKRAITKYVTTMHNLKRQQIRSLPVLQAIDYINQHLTQVMTNAQIAAAVHVHPDYLSKLFKKETGLSLSRFILLQKCNSARYLLENSQASCTEISTFLGFSSCSHFISRFRQVEDVTPEEYRRSKVRNSFSSYSSYSQQ